VAYVPSAAPAAGPTVRLYRGSALLLFAFDVGQAIDLERASPRLEPAARATRLDHRRCAPGHFQFEPPPLRVPCAPATLALSGGPREAPGECVLYDFGALSVCYAVDFDGPLSDLLALGAAAEAAGGAGSAARAEAERLLRVLGDAVHEPVLSPLFEDYVIYQVEAVVPEARPAALVAETPLEIARILRGEPDDLSEDEVRDALQSRLSFAQADLALVDWRAALLFDREPRDSREVLELANAQLLELRLLDDQLDRALDRSYETLRSTRGFTARLRPGPGLAAIGRMQVEGAVLHERVRNALKLLSDQFLARLYRLAATRFHFAEWDASIQRKIETIESIYAKSFDRAAARRLEILEWLIIFLIAAGLVLPFIL